MSGPDRLDRVAFGLRVTGVQPDVLLAADRPDWPELHVRRRRTEEASGDGGGGLQLALGDDAWLDLQLDRAPRTATFVTPEAIDEDRVVHPWLAPAAGLVARSLGREVFHAGAFVRDAGGWAVAGANEAGKSTLLAVLASAGTAVLTDDLLVVDRHLAYAGPRSIDLRTQLHPGDQTRLVRGGTRHRLALGSVAPAVPLRGWLFLEWSDRVEAMPCSAPERFARLVAQRRWPTTEVDPHVMLGLMALPAWRIRRPRGWAHMDAVVACVHHTVAGADPSGRWSRRAGRA